MVKQLLGFQTEITKRNIKMHKPLTMMQINVKYNLYLVISSSFVWSVKDIGQT